MWMLAKRLDVNEAHTLPFALAASKKSNVL